jgi:hypothetical protein
MNVKQFDARADKIDLTLTQGRQNGMTKEAFDALNKQCGFLRTQEKKNSSINFGVVK